MALFKVPEESAQEIDAKAKSKTQETVIEAREEQQGVTEAPQGYSIPIRRIHKRPIIPT